MSIKSLDFTRWGLPVGNSCSGVAVALVAVFFCMPSSAGEWTHQAYPPFGGFDHPLITFWNGVGWDPTGVVPDPRKEAPWAEGITVDFNAYSWEVTGHGRGQTPEAYLVEDLQNAVTLWYLATGRSTQIYNERASIVDDGSSGEIQVLINDYTGSPTPGDPDPAFAGPGYDSGQGLFTVVFPPGFDVNRPLPYPVVFISPGSGCTPMQYVLEDCDGGISRWGEILGQSVLNGGRGFLLLYGNTGGQGAQGLGSEYASAVNTMMSTLESTANADLGRVVLAGGSRGGANTLLHASRAGRNYVAEAAFAEVPATHYGALSRLRVNFCAIGGFYQVNTCWNDPDCINAWRWDHDPAPGDGPNNLIGSLAGTTDPTEADQRGPWGSRAGFDPGAWVHICAGPRDFVAGAGLALDYFDALPATVSARLDYAYVSAHGGSSVWCFEFGRTYILDKIAGNSAYGGAFDPMAVPGLFLHRLTMLDETPFQAQEQSDYDDLPAVTACGERPPTLLLPYVQQLRDETPTTEPSHFVLEGDAGRRWRVEMVDEPFSDTVIHTWEGVFGDPLPPGCEYYPRPDHHQTILCRYDTGLEQCVGPCGPGCHGVCGWKMAYDCDGDDIPESIPAHYTPFTGQPPAQTVVTDTQCGPGGAECVPPPDSNPYFGLPISVTPCLEFDNAVCAPADADSDGVSDGRDCAPSDPDLHSIPPEVAQLVIEADRRTIRWHSQKAAAGAVTVYDLARGTLGDLHSGGSLQGSGPCQRDLSSPVADDPDTPSSGDGYWYLARGTNPCGLGTWGSDTDSTERSVTACD